MNYSISNTNSVTQGENNPPFIAASACEQYLTLGNLLDTITPADKLPLTDRTNVALNDDSYAFDLITQSRRIAAKTLGQADCTDTEVMWPVHKTDQNGWSRIDCANYRLSDGVLGVLLYLARLDEVSPGSVDIGLVKQSAREQFTTLLNHDFEVDGCGAFEGLGGVIYVLSHLISLWPEEQFKDYGEHFINKMAKLVNGNLAFDVQAGSAGAILSLLSYYKVTSNTRALQISTAFGHQLVDAFTVKDGVSGWPSIKHKGSIVTGFAHGNAGIAYALMSLYKVVRKDDFYCVAAKAVAFEQLTYCAQTGNWSDLRFSSADEQRKCAMNAWCHGAMGIGYSRLMMQGLADESLNDLLALDVQHASAKMTSQTRLSDHGLHHGNFGNQEFVQQLMLSGHNIEITQSEFTDNINQCLAQLERQGSYPGQNRLETLGMMNGLTGVGYQLLKFALPNQVPSILMLQAPLW